MCAVASWWCASRTCSLPWGFFSLSHSSSGPQYRQLQARLSHRPTVEPTRDMQPRAGWRWFLRSRIQGSLNHPGNHGGTRWPSRDKRAGQGAHGRNRASLLMEVGARMKRYQGFPRRGSSQDEPLTCLMRLMRLVIGGDWQSSEMVFCPRGEIQWCRQPREIHRQELQ